MVCLKERSLQKTTTVTFQEQAGVSNAATSRSTAETIILVIPGTYKGGKCLRHLYAPGNTDLGHKIKQDGKQQQKTAAIHGRVNGIWHR